MAVLPFPYMPLYLEDFERDTRKLSHAEKWAYLRLCWFNFQEGPLPNDNSSLAKLADCPRESWRRMRPKIEPFFAVDNGTWTQKRAQNERDRARKVRSKRAHAANERWRKDEENQEAVDAHAEHSRAYEQTQTQTQTSLAFDPKGVSSEREDMRARDPHPDRQNGQVTDDRTQQHLESSWSPSLEDCQFAASRGWDDSRISAEAERFRDYYTSRGIARADWSACWRLWVQRSDSDFASKPSRGAAGSGELDPELREWLARPPISRH